MTGTNTSSSRRPARGLLFVTLSFAALAQVGCASSAPAEAGEPIALDEPAALLDGERYLEYRVGVHIAAPPAEVWALLTAADAYPNWNSTVIGIEGEIADGETIVLTSTVDPDRSFELLVTELEPGELMTWSDGGRAFRGERTFTLVARDDQTTEFTMREVMTGSMMGMIESSLPDFRPSFDAFAQDLRTAAEAE